MFDFSSIEHWLRGLLAAVITGGSQAALTVVGVGSMQSLGVNIPTFTPRQILLQCGIGGMIAAFTYLKQSPLPEVVEKTTVSTVATVTQTKTVEHQDQADQAIDPGKDTSSNG